MSIEAFFNKREIRTALNRYIHSLEGINPNGKFAKDLNLNTTKILNEFIRDPEYWDERTQSNIELIGKGFQEQVSFITDAQDERNLTFALALRFILEASLFWGAENEKSFYKEMQDFAIRNIDEFDDISRNQIRYSLYEMPIQIVRRFISHDEVKNYVLFLEAFQKAKALQENWITDLDQKKNV